MMTAAPGTLRMSCTKDWPDSTENGAWGGNRTHDLRITNALLYRLSYPGANSNLSSWVVAGTREDAQNSINDSMRSFNKSVSSMFEDKRFVASVKTPIA
jgi:hypothetical protein